MAKGSQYENDQIELGRQAAAELANENNGPAGAREGAVTARGEQAEGK